jgi:hypothetical protein
MVFKPDFLRLHTAALDANPDSRNWLCTLHLHSLLLDAHDPKSHKKLEKDYRELGNARRKLARVGEQRRFQDSLRVEAH